MSLLVVAVSLVTPAIVHADDGRDACVAAYVAGQKEQNQGALLRARRSFETCADDACPGLVKRDCAKWLEEVTQALPTIVVSVRDESGRDLVDAVATIDGARIAIDGKPLALDPGKHVVRAERPEHSPGTEQLVLAAGEHDRVVAMTLPAIAAAPSPAGAIDVPSPPPPSPPSPRTEGRIAPVTWLLGAGGIVAGGVFSYFAIRGASNRASFGCDRSCSSGDYDQVQRDFVIADVALGLGVAALAGAVVTWLLTRDTAAPSSTAAQR